MISPSKDRSIGRRQNHERLAFGAVFKDRDRVVHWAPNSERWCGLAMVTA